jgi:hypothetical protein
MMTLAYLWGGYENETSNDFSFGARRDDGERV